MAKRREEEEACKDDARATVGSPRQGEHGQEKKNMRSDSFLYATIGDLAHVVNLASCIVFTLAVFLADDNMTSTTTTKMLNGEEDDRFDADGSSSSSTIILMDSWWNILRRRRRLLLFSFDPQWKREGFCIARADEPYWSSHDVCVYFNLFSSAILALVYNRLGGGGGGGGGGGREGDDEKKRRRLLQRMQVPNHLLFRAIICIAAHAAGHVGMSIASSNGLLTEENGQLSGLETLRRATCWQQAGLPMMGVVLFWCPMLRAAMPNASVTATLALSAIAIIGNCLVEIRFMFTYIQMTVVAAFTFDQLNLPAPQKRDVAYATLPLLVLLPAGLAAWVESTRCSTTFVRDYLYGHLIYDATIPVGMLAWYLLCYNYYCKASSLDHDDDDCAKKSRPPVVPHHEGDSGNQQK